VQRQNELNNAKEALKLFSTKSPLDGIISGAVNEWTITSDVESGRYSYQCRSCSIRCYWMKIKTYINESDVKRVHKGWKVIVRLDASFGTF